MINMDKLVKIINHRILHIPYSSENEERGYDVDHDMYIPMSEIVSWDTYLDIINCGTYTNCWIKLNISLKNGKEFNGLSIYFTHWRYDEDREVEVDTLRKRISQDFVKYNQEYLNDVQHQAFQLLLANKMINQNVK